MPVFVDPKACVDREHCFAAGACPYDAFLHNPLKKTWEVDATICGDCPGPCLNFCDKDALHWGDDLEDLRLVKAQVEGTMKPEVVAEARLKHKQEVAEAAKRAEAERAAAAAAASAEGVIALTRQNFEREVLRSQVPVVVDCWADWCEPCKQFSPVFEATAKQYVGVVKFAKLDTEAQPALAAGLGVQALPTILMFYKGQLVNAVEGALPPQHFQSWMYQTLTAVRQYEKQLTAEAEDAIKAALDNLSALDAAADAALQGGAGRPSTGAGTAPAGGPAGPPDTFEQSGPGAQPGNGRPVRGKQTSSGLYIP
jgi:thioredoxin